MCVCVCVFLNQLPKTTRHIPSSESLTERIHRMSFHLMVYACMQVSVAGTNALRPCLFRCVRIILFFIGWLSRRLTHMVCIPSSICLFFYCSCSTLSPESQWTTTYQCVILFIYHLSGSGVLHLNIRLASNSNGVFFSFSPSFCAMFIETFMISQKSNTQQPHHGIQWQRIATICDFTD